MLWLRSAVRASSVLLAVVAVAACGAASGDKVSPVSTREWRVVSLPAPDTLVVEFENGGCGGQIRLAETAATVSFMAIDAPTGDAEACTADSDIKERTVMLSRPLAGRRIRGDQWRRPFIWKERCKESSCRRVTPRVVGMDQRDAVAVLRCQRIKAGPGSPGIVRRQSPPAGSLLDPRDEVFLQR